MHTCTVSYEFLLKPAESAECHQTLSTQVGSGHETNHTLAHSSLTYREGGKSLRVRIDTSVAITLCAIGKSRSIMTTVHVLQLLHAQLCAHLFLVF